MDESAGRSADASAQASPKATALASSKASADASAKANVAGNAKAKRWPRRHWHFLALLVTILAIALARPIAHHARAAELLVTFVDPTSKPAVTEELVTIDVPAAARPIDASAISPSAPPSHEHAAYTVKGRLYAPPGIPIKGAPAVVLVHGVHRLGIEEPRLQRFARSLVTAGLVVLTPQVDELADYHVAPRSIETVGAAVEALRARTGLVHVGLIGTSFGGGIALLTAADPRFADDVSFVVSVGGHDDLARVSRFFATDTILEESGATKAMHAHEYGGTVLVYSHAEDFFPADDVPAAREALRNWLWEKRDDARAAAKTLSPASKEKVERLFEAKVSPMRDELLAEIERRRVDMANVSPHDRLGNLRAHAYLLHGEGDTVIPATETLWLAKDVPPNALRDVLVSPAIVHVELKEPSALDRWKLVHFLAEVVGEAEATR